MSRYGRKTITRLIGGSLQFQTDGQAVENWLMRGRIIQENARNLTPLFNQMGQIMLDSIETQMSAGGVPKWSPLSSAYLAWKNRNYPGRPILTLTGKMRSNFRYQASKDELVIVNDTMTRSGHNLWGLHQEGAGRLPARPIRIRQQDKDEFWTRFRAYVYGVSR